MSTSSQPFSDSLRQFSSSFHGDLLRPDSDGYDTARKVWNGMIDRRPAVIARCKSVSDFQSAVRLGRENGRVYVNYIGIGEAPDRVRASFGEDKFARLVEIKRKYDPTNLFRINQNIPPE